MSKGYDFLSGISGGAGFWVNATSDFTLQLPAGAAITSAAFQSMGSGWNLIAIGDGNTPALFNQLANFASPLPGVTSLWAWDAAKSSWYFYAPSLEMNGGLANYIMSEAYLDFGTKVLAPTTGFWINVP